MVKVFQYLSLLTIYGSVLKLISAAQSLLALQHLRISELNATTKSIVCTVAPEVRAVSFYWLISINQEMQIMRLLIDFYVMTLLI